MKKGLISFICLLFIAVSASASDNPYDIILNGKKGLDIGDYENAVIQLSEAYERFPIIGDYILLWRAKAFEGKGEIDYALKDIDTIKNSYKDSPVIKAARKMELELLRDREDKIYELIESFIKDYPSESGVIYNYAMLLKKNGKNERAKSIFREIFVSVSNLSEKARDELSDEDITTDDLIKRGENLNSAFMFKEAEAIFKEALKRAEKAPSFSLSSKKKNTILEGLAYSIFRQKRYKEAAQLYSKTKNDYWLARALLRARDIESFESRLSKFINNGDKRFAPLLISYATIKRRDGDIAGALNILKNALSIYPSEKEGILWSIGWTHYISKDLKDACDAFSELYKTYGGSKYLYWRDRCLKRMKNGSVLSAGEKKTSGDDFYSILPLIINMKDNHRETEDVNIRLDSRNSCTPLPVFRRAEILSEIGLRDDAANELIIISKKASSMEELLSTICRLKNLKKYKSAIALASRIQGSKLSEEFMYPLAYPDEVIMASKESGLDPLLILSVMREESRFDPNARSIAGAIGLLQLMPETAIRVNKKIGMDIKNADELYDPMTNIKIGSYYLKELIHEFGSLPLAIASYNAGERVVMEWIKKGQYGEIDEFIEDIPYDETKNYVRKVLTSYFKYRDLLGNNTNEQDTSESM